MNLNGQNNPQRGDSKGLFGTRGGNGREGILMRGREWDGMGGILFSLVWVEGMGGDGRDFHLTLFGMRGEGRENIFVWSFLTLISFEFFEAFKILNKIYS